MHKIKPSQCIEHCSIDMSARVMTAVVGMSRGMMDLAARQHIGRAATWHGCTAAAAASHGSAHDYSHGTRPAQRGNTRADARLTNAATMTTNAR